MRHAGFLQKMHEASLHFLSMRDKSIRMTPPSAFSFSNYYTHWQRRFSPFFHLRKRLIVAKRQPYGKFARLGVLPIPVVEYT